MTRLPFMVGGETGHPHSEGITVEANSPQIVTTVARGGTRSMKFDSGASNVYNRYFRSFSGSLGTKYYIAFSLYLPSASGSFTQACRVMSVVDAAVTQNIWSIVLNTDDTLRLYTNHPPSAVGTASSSISKDAWHLIEVEFQINAGADLYSWKVDGTTIDSGLNHNSNDVAPGRIYIGQSDPGVGTSGGGANKVVYIDDVILNDNAGSVNNTWVGEEKIGLLLPISDNLNDGWRGGAGGTTNMFEAVNNTPPVGLSVSSATDASQNECANSDTTDNYDANMTSYSTAGLTAGDVVTAVQGIIVGANSSTTGTDTIGASVLSNPAIGETMVNVDIVAGTYPSGWATRGETAISENPSVTFGTSPVMSIRKGVATTRVASCCFMGMNVSYYEAAPPAVSLGPRVLSFGL